MLYCLALSFIHITSKFICFIKFVLRIRHLFKGKEIVMIETKTETSMTLHFRNL